MKVAFLSDTHTSKPNVPSADLLVHCGDVCGHGNLGDLRQQLKWLSSMAERFPKGIYLSPGNHDRCCQVEYDQAKALCAEYGVTLVVHEQVEIEGVKFFFSPYTPEFNRWFFMGEDTEEDLGRLWAQIPEDTEILVTHGPAKKILDWCPGGNVGSETLWRRINQLPNLKLHACGHIHESHGIQKVFDRYWAVNASWMDGYYRPGNTLFVFDTDDYNNWVEYDERWEEKLKDEEDPWA